MIPIYCEVLTVPNRVVLSTTEKPRRFELDGLAVLLFS
jgi:hypothetical protein